MADTDRGELDAPVVRSGLERRAALRDGLTLGPFATGLGAVLLVVLSAAVIGLGTGLETRLGVATLAALIGGLTVLLRPATAVLGVVAVTPALARVSVMKTSSLVTSPKRM